MTPRPIILGTLITLTLAEIVSLSSCAGRDPDIGEGEGEGEGEPCTVTPPAAYVSAEFDVNAAEAVALRVQLDALTVTAMREAEQGTRAIANVAELEALFEAASPSVAGITNAAFLPLVEDSFAEFMEVLAAGDQTLVDAGGLFTPGAAGGVYGSSDRGINEGGLEIRQVLDKALFAGAALYPYAVGLTKGTITVATVDALAAAWGGNSTLDVAGTLTDSANYANGMGYHAATATALIDARAYAADPLCIVERDAALVRFFRLWEKSMFARLVLYANEAATDVAAAADADAYAEALHVLSEGIGLGLGFRGVDDPESGPLAGAARLVSDADIELIMNALAVDIDDLGASGTGALLIETSFTAPVQALEDAISDALGVSDSELEGWRTPTAG